LVLTGSGYYNIFRAQTGGNGGKGGNADDKSDRSFGGGGGSGGIGLLLTNPAGATVDINSAVSGRNGGAGGVGVGQWLYYYPPAGTGSVLTRRSGDGNGAPGPGGVGISGQNLQIALGSGGSVAAGWTPMAFARRPFSSQGASTA